MVLEDMVWKIGKKPKCILTDALNCVERDAFLPPLGDIAQKDNTNTRKVVDRTFNGTFVNKIS